MSDLCDDLALGLGQVDYELLNVDEDQDQEFLGDQEVEVIEVDASIVRRRSIRPLCSLGTSEPQDELKVDDDEGSGPVYPDYTLGMMVAAQEDDSVMAGSRARAPLSRSAPYRRR